ncbi:hypothetical protein [Candidatus Methylobacter oryzae]|uniref:Uncharacterized protein n=1 Tax=Candidatus Methylobacter oryzae TaxID=2497749 RepID=A0ABY3C5W0_9GAMM|nr:hypothetical protein [Candidatus Methylobacter oryzae]TRW90004.1 hypothetical protein EKO24_020505 [Candidatus Methylobacter oryzae]
MKLKMIVCGAFMSLILVGCFSPTKPQVIDYVECRNRIHESYLNINPKMKVANALDYGLILNTNNIYQKTIDAIYSDQEATEKLMNVIYDLPCFSKTPSSDEKMWLKPYHMMEIGAELKYINKKALPVIEAIVSKKQEEQWKTNRHLLQEIGTKVCRDEGNIGYVGYIEGIQPKKIKIRVSDSRLLSSSTLKPGDFKESIIWDIPKNWYVCE